MNESRRPLIALTGALFTALMIIGTLLYPSAPDFLADPAEIAAHYVDDASGILIANVVYLLGGVTLFFFGGYLWTVARRAEGGEGRLAMTAFAGLVAGLAVLFISSSLDMVGALRADDAGVIDPQIAATVWDASSVLYGTAAPMALAVLVLSSAGLAFRHGLFPAWHGGISVVLGIVMLVPPIAFFGIIVFNFWVLLSSVMLYAGEPSGAKGTQPAPALG